MMSGETQITALIDQAARNASLNCVQTHAGDAAYIKLPPDWETYLASLPKKKRYSLRSARRDFELWLGERTARMHTATDSESLRTGMAILQQLHNARWQQQGQSGAFSHARFVTFHEQYAHLLLDASKLWLQWLTVDGEPVAALYQFVGENKIYFNQNGRQLGLPKKVRIGIVALTMAIEVAIQQGMHEFDLLAGDAHYKRLFANASRPLVQLRLTNKGVGGGTTGGFKEKLLQALIAAARFKRSLLPS
jgi:CelD/BcsL family acetyltransferase involved in cellulose biosynthesis